MPLIVPRPNSTGQAASYRAQGSWLHVTLPELLWRRAAERPDAPAIIAPEKYEEIGTGLLT